MTSAGPRRRFARSVPGGATLRFGAEGVWAVTALFAGAIVGRQIGPDGKGLASTLGFIVALAGPLAAAGLGEAIVTTVRQDGVPLPRAIAATVPLLAATSAAGMALFVVAAFLQFPDLHNHLRGSIIAGALTVPFIATSQVLAVVADGERRFVMTSVSRIVTGATTAIATAVLLFKLHRGVAGAIAAGGIGFASGTVVLLAGFVATGTSFRPRPDLRFARRALRFGLPLQLGFLLVGVTARADILLVEAIRTGREAGLYSVGLTFSQLVSFAPAALAAAAFGVIAGLPAEAVGAYADRVLRVGIALAVGSAIVMAALSSVLVPLAFGHGFKPAIATTIQLLPSGVLYSQQWIVCRATAARARSRAVLASFLTSTVVMIVVDLLLIPDHGRSGAAIGGAIGALAGVVVALRGYATVTNSSRLLSRVLVVRRSDIASLRYMLRPAAPQP